MNIRNGIVIIWMLVVSIASLQAVPQGQALAAEVAKQEIDKLLDKDVAKMNTEEFSAWKNSVDKQLATIKQVSPTEAKKFDSLKTAVSKGKETFVKEQGELQKKLEEEMGKAEKEQQQFTEKIENIKGVAQFSSISNTIDAITVVDEAFNSRRLGDKDPLHHNLWFDALHGIQVNQIDKANEEQRAELAPIIAMAYESLGKSLEAVYKYRLEKVGKKGFFNSSFSERIGKINDWIKKTEKVQLTRERGGLQPIDYLKNELNDNVISYLRGLYHGGNKDLLSKKEIQDNINQDKVRGYVRLYLLGSKADGDNDEDQLQHSFIGLLEKYIEYIEKVFLANADKDPDKHEKEAVNNFIDKLIVPIHKDFKALFSIFEPIREEIDKAKVEAMAKKIEDLKKAVEDAYKP